VTVVERNPRLLDGADPAVGEGLAGAFRREGITVLTGATAGRVRRDPDGRRRLSLTVDGEEREAVAEALLVATGRRARLDGLGLDEAGVALTESGDLIAVDETMRSRQPDVYAAGDVAAPRQATHLAVVGGEVAGYNAARDLGFDGGAAAALAPPGPLGRPLGGVVRAGADGRLRVDYSVLPEVLFTEPGYARVGMSEPDAARAGIACVAARYPFAEVGMAQVMGQTEGFLKLLAGREDGRLLGAEILGVQADTLVHEAVLALAFGATAAQLARVPHYHPTLSEVFPSAAAALLEQLEA
jgi:pyruvate/2-oxoglutarate dehydrogenase complex dihydrolipoamide dehydrogenase (E3) component